MSGQSRHMDVADAARLLREAQSVCADFPSEKDSLPLAEAARRICVSVKWVREHLSEFPNAWRLPAGERQAQGEGHNVGEIRIPVTDLTAFQERQKIRRA